VIRDSVDTPGVAKVLNGLSAKLTTVQISKLNLLVTADKENPVTVADRWLQQQGLI
jgi:glycine betaine/choline ABC-type transport system substrate-binding protein